jgi:hypothetical protein
MGCSWSGCPAAFFAEGVTVSSLWTEPLRSSKMELTPARSSQVGVYTMLMLPRGPLR